MPKQLAPHPHISLPSVTLCIHVIGEVHQKNTRAAVPLAEWEPFPAPSLSGGFPFPVVGWVSALVSLYCTFPPPSPPCQELISCHGLFPEGLPCPQSIACPHRRLSDLDTYNTRETAEGHRDLRNKCAPFLSVWQQAGTPWL